MTARRAGFVLILGLALTGCGEERGRPAPRPTPAAAGPRPDTGGPSPDPGLASAGSATRLGATGAEVLLRTQLAGWQRHIASSASEVRLLDVDGDGRHELVLWRHDGDDTGMRERRQVYAWRGTAFADAPGLVDRVPAQAFRPLRSEAPDLVAVAAALGVGAAYPLAIADLDVIGDRPPATGAAAVAGELRIGPDVGYLCSYPTVRRRWSAAGSSRSSTPLSPRPWCSPPPSSAA